MKNIMKTLVIIFLLLFLEGCKSPQTGSIIASGDIALYSDKGADKNCLIATTRMLEWMGYTVAPVKAKHIKNQSLDTFNIILFPGGNMYQYAGDLSAIGREKIRNYIRNGGSYIGICGGAYFASEEVIWKGQQLPMTPLKIFPGISKGPLDEIIPYPDYGMCKVIFSQNHPITSFLPDTAWMLYYWGPVLIPNPGSNVTVLGVYNKGNNYPVMIAFQYGAGKVFLIGTHPEFEEDSDRDGVDFGDEFNDLGSDWELMKNAVLWCMKREN